MTPNWHHADWGLSVISFYWGNVQKTSDYAYVLSGYVKHILGIHDKGRCVEINFAKWHS